MWVNRNGWILVILKVNFLEFVDELNVEYESKKVIKDNVIIFNLNNWNERVVF